MNDYFKLTDTVYDITEKYPEAKELLISHGFEQLKNDLMRKTMGKTISLETALKSRKINPELFGQKLAERIEQGRYAAGTGLSESACSPLAAMRGSFRICTFPRALTCSLTAS